MNISIKNKNIIIVCLLILGLSILTTFGVSTMSHNRDLYHSQAELNQLSILILQLRRNEKDFLSRNLLKYRDKFNDDTKKLNADFKLLEKNLKASGIDDKRLGKLKSESQQYFDSFAKVVQQKQKIGLTPTSGLYGDLRGSIHGVEKIIKGHSELNSLMLTLRRHEKDFMLRRDTKYIGRFNDGIDKFSTQLAQSLSGNQLQQANQLLNTYQYQFSSYTDAEQVLGLTPKNGLRGQMRAAAHQLEEDLAKVDKQLQKEIDDGVSSSSNWFISMAIIMCLISAAVMIFVSRSIYVPLKQTRDKLQQLTQDNNLSLRLDYDGQDEVGEITHAINELLSTMQSAMRKITTTSQELVNSSGGLSSVTEDVRKSCDLQASEVDQVAAAMNEMTATVQEMASNASLAAESVNAVRDHVDSGVAAGQAARHEIENLTQEVQSAVEAIEELERNSENIGHVLDAIQGIAEQTNLLALNAAIEAARAGEQGRGFAVVADEVRTLAQRTQESTETIRQTIAEFQQGTGTVVATVTRSNEQAEAGITKVNQSSQILSEISDQVNQINDMNIQIASGAEQQSATGEEINRNITRIADLSREVKEQVYKNASASNKLGELGVGLGEMVDKFKL